MEYGKLVKRQDIEKLENKSLAPYAVSSSSSRGREYKEKEHPYRTRFQRDRDRVIHSSAFRRLEYKTQVFVYHEGDYYRTRLTHSMEVAQIARSICKSMQLNEDLAESIALSHDLGHPPFGHTGQKILNGLLKDHGGFEHNKQGLRVVKLLEKRYPEFNGLNLTWELQEGISKHSIDPENPITKIQGYHSPSLEAQVVDCADGIAYNAHDLDDGITSGLLNLEQVRKLVLWREHERELDQKYIKLDFKLKKYQIVRQIINDLITDFRQMTLKNLKANKNRMLSLSNEGYTTATDFADYLVQNNNLSFREAYKISAKLVNYAEKKRKKLNELDFSEIKKVKSDLSKNVMKIFNVINSVDLKTSYGGTSTKNIKMMITKIKKELKQ